MSSLTSKENFDINSGMGLSTPAFEHAFDSNSSKVSIIIPHFDRGELLLQTLSSIEKQTYKNWEVIVVDDGSDPNEWSRAQQFADSRVRFVQRDGGIKGPSRCRNLGLKEITGDLVMFVDSDDIVAPWCLAERTARIEASPGVDYCVFPVMLFQKTPGDMATLWNRLEGDNDLERFLKSDPPWHTSSPLWRRAAIEQLRGFDEEIMYGDDTDLHLRALFVGIPYEKVDCALPDVFVRRASENRITNTLSDRLLDSRIVRLERGTRLVQQFGTLEQCLLWAAQYFIEAEFLLFCVPASQQRQKSILDAWKQAWTPPVLRWVVLQGYLRIAQVTRKRCYLILRIARRVVMMIMPAYFFPQGGGFESTLLPEADFHDLLERLTIPGTA